MKKPHSAFQNCTWMGLTLFGLFGCVSVNIPSSGPTHAPKVEYKEPSSPFKPEKTEVADKAWESEQTGNTIAYFSDCNPSSDMELKSIANDALTAISDRVLVDARDFTFAGREALEWQASGKVDGVPVKIWLVVFKKNGCNFTLSFLGSAKYLSSEKRYFSDFLDSFQVPSW